MKRYNHLLVPSLVCLLLGTIGCNKEPKLAPDNTDNSMSRVLSSTLKEVTFKGGTATVTLSESASAVRADVPWIKPTLSDKDIKVAVEPNNSYESRTGNIIATFQGQEVTMIPLTQLGIVNIMELRSMRFPAMGGTLAFRWIPGQDYELTGVEAPWLSSEIRGDSIYFTATENGLYDPSRSITGHLKAGDFIDEDIVIQQDEYLFAYEHVIGKYTLEYSTWDGNPRTSMEVSIQELDKKKGQLAIVCPGYTIVASFDSKLPGIRIQGQAVMINGTKVDLAPWEGKNGGALWPSPKFGVMSKWNNDKKNVILDMVPDGVVDESWVSKDGKPVVVRGFIIWPESAASGQPSRLINMKLTKKVE